MKKKRSLCAALLAGLMVTAVCLTGCGQKAADNGSSGADSDKVYQVGVCQLTQHDALDAATQGFVDALNTILGSEHVNIDVQVASGDSTTCTPIVNSFVNKKVDLIMANATPALQAAYNATTSIPILGTSVTEYGVALGLSDFSGTVGGNISGTSDLAPLTEQADMILELVPNAKNVGLLYCSAEPNSEYQVKVVEDYLSGKGITCTRYSFSDSNDVAAVTTKAAADSDVIYIPTDNTAASYASTIHNVVVPAGVPVITGDTGTCSGCGVAVLGIDYYELGQITGEMAYEILVEGADPATMEVRSAPTPTKMYNPSICEELGITPPEDYTALES